MLPLNSGDNEHITAKKIIILLKMKTLDEILQQESTFEPSKGAKDLILKSIKNTFKYEIEGKIYEVPGFLSYDINKYKVYTYIVFLIYCLEFFAAFSIIVTTQSTLYIIIKLLIILMLIYTEILIAKHNRSKDNELKLTKYINTYILLISEFYKNLLSEVELEAINKSINDTVTKNKEIRIFNYKMLFLLSLTSFAKIFAFYLDIILKAFNGLSFFENIFLKNSMFLVCFFCGPIVYILIHLLNWKYYGVWIWTGDAETKLRNELIKHNQQLKTPIKKGIIPSQKIQYLSTSNNIRISITSIISEINSLNKDKKPEIISYKDYLEKKCQGKIKQQKENNFNIFKGKDDNNYFIEFIGIFTDVDLQSMVSNEMDTDLKKMLLLLGIQYQITCSQRET